MRKIILILVFVCCSVLSADAQAWIINKTGQAAKELVKKKKRAKEIKEEMAEAASANKSDYTTPPPATTLPQTAEQVAAEQEQLATRPAEPSERPWPRSKMSTALQKECLVILQDKFPKLDIRRVSIESENWHVNYNGGTPASRVIRVWADRDGGDGVRVASDFTLYQSYQGGGQYGGTKFHGRGDTSFVIAE